MDVVVLNEVSSYSANKYLIVRASVDQTLSSEFESEAWVDFEAK